MSSSKVPRNAYTDSPEQNPAWIVGSLQLLLWIFFHPSAWRNHLIRIDPALHPDSQSWSRLHWRNSALWWLLIQGYLILPLLFNLSLNLLMRGLGKSGENLTFYIVIGVGISLVFGLAFGFAVNTGFGVVISVALGIAFGLAFDVTVRVTTIAFAILLICLGVCWQITHNLPVGEIFSNILRKISSLAVVIKPMLKLLRLIVICPFIKIFNSLLYQFDKVGIDSKHSLFRYNSAFWDEWQHRPLKGLDKHLVLVMERKPDEGNAAIKYLSTRPQRWAAQAALIEMDTRRIERCTDLTAIRQVHRDLATGQLELETLVSALIRSFNRNSKDVDAALTQVTIYNQRLALKNVANRLDDLSRELITTNEEYAVRLQPVPIRWSQIINDHVDKLAQASELRQEIDSPYVIGIPLTEEQEIFTGRADISSRIEQLLLDRRRPPLLLYGQRRMGKTSLLYNLGRLLPSTIIPIFVDLQGPVSSASDYAGFLYNIAKGMVDSVKRQSAFILPSLSREVLKNDPFTYFDEWLDEVEQALKDNTALLALDEFEVLDNAIAKGRFDEQDVLGMLRHLIQHRPRFKVLLSGSHTLEEFERWASYLINVQVLYISYLNEAEARQLIERPVKDFPLHYEPDAVERVLELTRCHPCLVQILCAEIVALKNEQDPADRRLANSSDVEQAVSKALSSSSFFFADIERNQVNTAGLELLRFLAAKGEGATVSNKVISRQFPDNPYKTLDLLVRRELLEQTDDGYRFQVELIRRWFAASVK